MKKYLSIIALTLATPFIALADGANIDNVKTPDTATEVTTALTNITNWMFTIFLMIAMMFIILAAFSFLTSSGNPEKTGSAKKQLIYAIVAVAVAVLAKSMVTVTCSILNATCK